MWYCTFVKSFLNFIHTQQPVPTLKHDNTPDVSIKVECCPSQVDAEFGLHMILRKDCLWSTHLWGDVDCFHGLIGCPRWPLPLPCPPRQKIGWVPQGTGCGHHLIWFWTARSNSGEQIQQTRANPEGKKIPRSWTWRALWLWSMWSHPNLVGSGLKHRVRRLNTARLQETPCPDAVKDPMPAMMVACGGLLTWYSNVQRPSMTYSMILANWEEGVAMLHCLQDTFPVRKTSLTHVLKQHSLDS